MTTTHRKPSTHLRDTLEAFAGYNPPPFAGHTILVFGACASGGHDRCPGKIVVGPTTYLCRCCAGHGLPDPAAWEQEYGTPWWGE